MARVLSREERIVEQRERPRAEAEDCSNELASLLTVYRSVASRLEMQPLLDAILDASGPLPLSATATREKGTDALKALDWDLPPRRLRSGA
jgi:hypothetical protein